MLRHVLPWTRIGCLLAATLLSACTAQSVTGVIEGEPVCPDFELAGGNKLKGSLKRPVRVSLLEGDDVRWERVLLGRRSPDDPKSKFVVEDDDETYTVRWAQCPNVFAPRRATSTDERETESASSYACGEAEVYKEHELTIKEGDASSRVLQWVAPPDPACWEGEAPKGATSASASASASAAPPETAASAEPVASAAASSAAPAASASAPPSKAPAPKAPAPKAPTKPPAPAPPAPTAPAPLGE